MTSVPDGTAKTEARLKTERDCRLANEAELHRADAELGTLRLVALEAASMLAETNHGGLSFNRKESMRLALEAAGVAIPAECERCPHPAPRCPSCGIGHQSLRPHTRLGQVGEFPACDHPWHDG